MRAFVAIELPPSLRRDLAARARRAQSECESGDGSGAAATPSGGTRRARRPPRWVREENLHLTLSFLGETGQEQIGALEAGLAAAAGGVGRFPVRLTAPGRFPAVGRARALWIGLEGGEPLGRLHQRVCRAVDAARGGAGDPVDRAFRPHVTLARCDPPWPAAAIEPVIGQLAGPPAAAAAAAPASFVVAEIVLFESRLASGGPDYRALSRFALADADRRTGTAGAEGASWT